MSTPVSPVPDLHSATVLRATDAIAVTEALLDAADAAIHAPSVHNTQPWRMEIVGAQLSVRADRSRQLRVLDPDGRDLEVSCGAAVATAEVSLAAAGRAFRLELLPDRHDADLLARLTVRGHAPATPHDLALAAAVPARHTNRRPFLPVPVSAEQLDRLLTAGRGPEVWASAVLDPDRRVAVAVLVQRSEELQLETDGYLRELAAWTGRHGSRDGIPMASLPAHGSPWDRGDVPVRDFDPTHAGGGLPARVQSSRQQTLLVLGSDGDTLRDRLLAGRSLMRVLLQATADGLVCSVFTGVVEVPFMRARLRAELDTVGVPQVVLRVGVAEPVPSTPRRPLSETVVRLPS